MMFGIQETALHHPGMAGMRAPPGVTSLKEEPLASAAAAANLHHAARWMHHHHHPAAAAGPMAIEHVG